MTFKPRHDPSHLYFVTATILDWRHLFREPALANIVLQSLDWHRRHGRWSLYAYVLMPNHLHAIVKPEATQTISSVLQSFGSFTAHGIMTWLRNAGREDILAFLSRRMDKDSSKGSQVWQPIQAKNIHSATFLREKLEYTHSNPVAKHWALATDRADYAYSSACFYDTGALPVVEVDDARELLL